MTAPHRPRIVVALVDRRSVFHPGELLSCEYRIEMPRNPATTPEPDSDSPQIRVDSVECSVLWYTEGKGDEDIGVHFFERREKKLVQHEVLRQPHRLNTVLPATPLTYDGNIVKICWCVRLRIFLSDGSNFTESVPFELAAFQI